MNQKPFPILILTFFIGSFLAGCTAGTRTPSVTPPHLTAGAKAMHKGIGWYRKGCFTRALHSFFAAHQLYVAVDQQEGVAASLDSMGNAYQNLGDPDSAIRFHDEAITIYQSQDDTVGMCQAMVNKSAALIDTHQLDAAADLLDRSEAIAQEQGISLFQVMNNRGVLLTHRKAYEAAEVSLRQALHLAGTENPQEVATVNYALGRLMQETGRHDRALEHFFAALDADRKSGYHKGIADDVAALGEVYAALRQYALAAGYLKRAAQIFALMGYPERSETAMARLTEISVRTKADLSVTRHFMDRWLGGEISENPCE